MVMLPFVRHGERATELLALVHTDVCGPFDMQVRGGYAYSLPLSMIYLDMDMCI